MLTRLTISGRLFSFFPAGKILLLWSLVGFVSGSMLCCHSIPPAAAQRVNTRKQQETGPGSWHRSRTLPPGETIPELTPDQIRRIQQLESLGYVGGAEQP
ncbi:MAG: hypothetical protein ABIF77_21655, partial [bacterium]